MKHWPRYSAPSLTGTSAKDMMPLSAGNGTSVWLSYRGEMPWIIFATKDSDLCLRLGKIMVQATMAVYKDTIDSFLPTPSKSHYIFNLRDFARVIRGVLLAPHTHLQVIMKTVVKCLNKLSQIALITNNLFSSGWRQTDPSVDPRDLPRFQWPTHWQWRQGDIF